MVLGQPVHHFLQGDNSSRGDDSHLAHAATQHFTQVARPRNESLRTDKHGSNRRSEPFAQAKHDGICRTDQFLDRYTLRYRRIENPCAIDMQRQSLLMGNLTYSTSVSRRERNTAAHVLRILQTDQARNRVVHVLGPDRGADIFERQCSIRLVLHWTRLDATQGSHPSRLIQINMRKISNDHFIPTLTMDEQS